MSNEEVLAELDKLIGLDLVKQEVKRLTSFLEIQQQRQTHGLPASPYPYTWFSQATLAQENQQ